MSISFAQCIRAFLCSSNVFWCHALVCSLLLWYSVVFVLILCTALQGICRFSLHVMHKCVGELDIKRLFVFDI